MRFNTYHIFQGARQTVVGTKLLSNYFHHIWPNCYLNCEFPHLANLLYFNLAWLDSGAPLNLEAEAKWMSHALVDVRTNLPRFHFLHGRHHEQVRGVASTKSSTKVFRPFFFLLELTLDCL